MVLCLKCKSMKLGFAITFEGLVSHLLLGNPTSEFLGMLEVHGQLTPDLC